MDYIRDYGLGGTVKKTRGRSVGAGRVEGRHDRFVPNDQYSQRVRMMVGKYEVYKYSQETGEVETVELPYYALNYHYIPAGRGRRQIFLVCSAGPDPHNPLPCVPCDEYDDGDTENRKQPRTVFNLIVLEWFHRTPWIKAGETDPVMTKGKPVLIDVMCEGDNCTMCNSEDERFFGKRMYWELSDDQLGQLIAKEDRYLHTKCKCGLTMNIERFECSQCGKALIVPKTSKISQKQIQRHLKDGIMCDGCKILVDMLPILDCKCGKPHALNVFEVDMEVSYLTSTSGKKSYNLEIAFSEPRELDKEYKGEKAPLDLAAILAPKPTEKQFKACGFRGRRGGSKVDNAYAEKYEDEGGGKGGYSG